MKALNAHALATQHAMQQVTIEFRDATAFVESYVLARHKVRRDGQLILETFGGRYVDRFENRAGEWRIAHRQVIHDWSKIEPIAAEYPSESFEQGRRSQGGRLVSSVTRRFGQRRRSSSRRLDRSSAPRAPRSASGALRKKSSAAASVRAQSFTSARNAIFQMPLRRS